MYLSSSFLQNPIHQLWKSEVHLVKLLEKGINQSNPALKSKNKLIYISSTNSKSSSREIDIKDENSEDLVLLVSTALKAVISLVKH